MAVARNAQVHERTRRSMTVIEKHKLTGANTVTLMKHKHRYVVLAKNTRIDDANMAAIMFGTAA